MKLFIVASHLNRLDEAILIDDTMYSSKEKFRKMFQTYIRFCFTTWSYGISRPPKLKHADISFSLNRENLILQMLSVLQ